MLSRECSSVISNVAFKNVVEQKHKHQKNENKEENKETSKNRNWQVVFDHSHQHFYHHLDDKPPSLVVWFFYKRIRTLKWHFLSVKLLKLKTSQKQIQFKCLVSV